MMYHQRRMKANLKIVSYGFLICISFFLITFLSLQQRETGKIDKKEVIQKKAYDVHIADDLLWQAISNNGVASISIGSMHIEKQRFGGFFIALLTRLIPPRVLGIKVVEREGLSFRLSLLSVESLATRRTRGFSSLSWF